MLRCRDVRIPFALLLVSYVVIGMTVLGFNRSPWQAGLTVGTALVADWLLNGWLRGRGWTFPWSGLITGLGLCLLLNYGSHAWLPVLPPILAIASKSVLAINGRHAFNPGLFGLIAGMLLSGGQLSPAPAYQWGGSLAMAFVLAGCALLFVVPKIKRGALLVSFALFYTLQLVLRAWIMRHHLPPEAIILGTITSPAFFLFLFYMLTDPATTPASARGQVLFALGVTVVDLFFHFRQSYSTLFPALFVVQGALFAGRAGSALLRDWKQQAGPLVARATAIGAVLTLAWAWRGGDEADAPAEFRLAKQPDVFAAPMGDLLDQLDPRVQHIGKWILSVGDAVAVADVDSDGLLDVFLTYPLKQPGYQNTLWLNRGDLKFDRCQINSLQAHTDSRRHGLPSIAVFADYDSDGDQDLFVGMGYGPSRLFRNGFRETGRVGFDDVTIEAGLGGNTVCLAALFFDPDLDGDVDLLVGNAMNPYLPDYKTPTPLNPFELPEPAYAGDRRMFHFMHASWQNAVNGGENVFYENRGDGTFARKMGRELGMPETHWTLAINSADFNDDGLPDLYVASDFGPDDVYLNTGDLQFERMAGKTFGSIGRDTYKGMNVSIADFDRSGTPDVYVSNVHAPLQAEGSLLWLTTPRPNESPGFRNEAARRGALNAHRFGWGAAVGDLDLNGWPDIVQANGMVDDSIDRRFETPRDYWYANGRLARTGPDIHAYADQWGDLRGYSIWGQQRHRVLLNRQGSFSDAAVTVGMSALENARGVALADFDNDGDLDALLTHQFKSASLYRNDMHGEPNWIGIDLPEAIHASVRVTADGFTQTQWARNATGFSAQGDRRLLFGLGSTDGAVDVRIDFADGSQRRELLNSRAYHIIRTTSRVAALR